MSGHRKLTREAWQAEARERFGDDAQTWRFVCPSCRHEAAVADWKAVEAPAGAIAFSCIGRWQKDSKRAADAAFKGAGGPCNYTGGGLFGLNPVTVVDDEGREHSMFEFAAPAIAGEAVQTARPETQAGAT